ncbi:hypothetical protein LguiB_023148 [Lonicera macranthoides]
MYYDSHQPYYIYNKPMRMVYLYFQAISRIWCNLSSRVPSFYKRSIYVPF